MGITGLGLTSFATNLVAASRVSFRRNDIFAELRASTLGLDTHYPICDSHIIRSVFPNKLIPDSFDGKTFPQTYLDSTATTKMIGPVAETRKAIDLHYANTHSHSYGAARIMTDYFSEAHREALNFVNGNPLTQVAVFVGSGATGAVNRIARNLFVHKPDKNRQCVIFSGKEHHANQIPWQKYAGERHSLGIPVDKLRGQVDMNAYRQAIQDHGKHLRLVAMNGISNVTGVVEENLVEMAELANRAGALFLVDWAQGLAHHPIDMQEMGIDFLVASGHKVYAPGSPGLMIMPKITSPDFPDEAGGGIVDSVNMDSVMLSQKLPDREEAGTPNVAGAMMFASALRTLSFIGMDRVWEHETELTEILVDGLVQMNGVTLYGDPDLNRTPRAGVATFNVDNLHHAIVSQALADYFNVATRNECFCAHPYVKSLLGMTEEELKSFEHDVAEGKRSNTPGMVRASTGIYNSEADIFRFLLGLNWIVDHSDDLAQQYYVDDNGNAIRHDGWQVNPDDYALLPKIDGDDLVF